MDEEHQDLDKPIYVALRNLDITQSREEAEERMNQKRDLSCYYSLRENPKKKTQKSPDPMKKILFRCQECGKGFRYEKCFSNHQAVMHVSPNRKVYEESLKSLCSSFGLVRKKKRSKVNRYKKTSLSCSFTTLLGSPSVFAANDEELEVADCLILLSKSSPKLVDGLKLVAEAVDANPETPKASFDLGCLRNKKLRRCGEFESGFFSIGQKLMEDRVSSSEPSKEPASFLDQHKWRKAGEFESGYKSHEQKLLKDEITTHETFKGPVSFLGHKRKLWEGDGFGTAFLSNEPKTMEETWKEPASFLLEKNEPDQVKLRKAGALEFYKTELGVGAMECSDSDTEMVTESDMKNVEHQCRLCNKIFSSYQALGGHQTFHRMSKNKNKKYCREESVLEPEDKSVTMEKKTHTCSICSRSFGSVHALGGHKKSHGKRQHSKTEEDANLGFLSVVPLTAGVQFN